PDTNRICARGLPPLQWCVMPATLPNFGNGSTVQPLPFSMFDTACAFWAERFTDTISTLPEAETTQLSLFGIEIVTSPEGSRLLTRSLSKYGQLVSFFRARALPATPSVDAIRFAARSRC